jgi:hypothetical protein
MSAASITNPTNTSNGVAVIVAHFAHVAERLCGTGFVLSLVMTATVTGLQLVLQVSIEARMTGAM